MKNKLLACKIATVCILIPVLSGCTNVYENGKVVFHTSSNLRGVHYRSPAGTVLDVEQVDNSGVHQAIGTEVSKGILSTGSAIMTSGVTKAL